MIALRPASARGVARLDWLYSQHTFSFGDYYDPDHMGFATLRVLNEDQVQPGGGFATHGHRDMEIISYVLAGALAHEDSLGNGSIIRPGEVQRMSAGTGIRHSEFNHSKTEPVHLLQIWIVPQQGGLAPSYEQKMFSAAEKRNRLRLVGSMDGRDGSLRIHQDVDLYAAVLSPGAGVTHAMDPARKAWVQVARGMVELNGQKLTAGDGAALVEEDPITLQAATEAEILLFDMA